MHFLLFSFVVDQVMMNCCPSLSLTLFIFLFLFLSLLPCRPQIQRHCPSPAKAYDQAASLCAHLHHLVRRDAVRRADADLLANAGRPHAARNTEGPHYRARHLHSQVARRLSLAVEARLLVSVPSQFSVCRMQYSAPE